MHLSEVINLELTLRHLKKINKMKANFITSNLLNQAKNKCKVRMHFRKRHEQENQFARTHCGMIFNV